MLSKSKYFVAIISATLTACDSDGNLGVDESFEVPSDTSSAPRPSLAGYWTNTQCSIASGNPENSTRTDLLFSNNEVSELDITFYRNTDCRGDTTLTSTLKGTYSVNENSTDVANGDARNIDLQFSTASYSTSPALTELFAQQGTTLLDSLRPLGLTQVDNLPASTITNATDRYTVFRLEGNTLSLGTGNNDSSNTSDTRLNVLNTKYRRTESNTTRPDVQAIDNSNLSSLAALNATIPAANRPRSAIAPIVEVFVPSPPYIAFEGRMMMTFPNGYSTYCMDWDIVNESPTPESIGDRCDLTREAQDDTPLTPFQPGERVNIAFGSLTGSGYQVPGVISSSSIRQGDLLLNDAGEIIISSSNLSSTSGTSSTVSSSSRRELQGYYYLNGYTLTVKFLDGTVYHDYIGILKKEGGRITSLFLGNRFYSENL